VPWPAGVRLPALDIVEGRRPVQLLS
jgi:hypothetical protein